jgi:hypothetical protein
MRLCCLVTGFAVILTFAALACAAPARVAVYDFEIDCQFFRGDPNGKPEQFASPTKAMKSGAEGRFSDIRQVEAGGQVLVAGREVRVTALSGKDGNIQVEVTAELAEVAGPNNLPQVQQISVKQSAVVRPGDKLMVELREKHWVEITVRKAK